MTVKFLLNLSFFICNAKDRNVCLEHFPLIFYKENDSMLCWNCRLKYNRPYKVCWGGMQLDLHVILP